MKLFRRYDVLIELDNVSYQYKGSDTTNLNNFSLTIQKGECVLLCGKSGCGKTTVTKLVNGIIPYLSNGEKQGLVTLNNQNIENIPMYKLSQIVGSVFQNPKSQFFNLDTDSELTFALENQGLPVDKIKERLEEVTNKLAIHHLRKRNIFELSGGEKQLIAIASVYMANPEIFVLDEPTANLDLLAIDTLKEILLYMKQEGKTILIAEHRLSYLKEIVDKVVFMENGFLKEIYTNKEFYNLSDSKRKSLGLRRLHDEIEEVSGNRYTKKEISVCLNNISISYGKKSILTNISLKAHKGDIIGITGSNGIGKSSLCRTICGLHSLTKGNITYSENLARIPIRLQMSYLIMQDVNHQLFGESVEDECIMNNDTATVKQIEDILKIMDLFSYRQKHPMALSGGQKQRLAIAVSLLLKKDIYIFDEPTSGLDYVSMCSVREQIISLTKKGATVFLVTHDMELLDTLCNRCLFLCSDKIVEIFRDKNNYSVHVKRMLLENRE